MLPNSVASTRTFRSDPSSANCKMFINSPYHAKHPVPFPSIFMVVKAMQEQFVKHARSHSELLILMPTQAASSDKSGMTKRSNLTKPSPFLRRQPRVLPYTTLRTISEIPIPWRLRLIPWQTHALKLINIIRIAFTIRTTLPILVIPVFRC